MYVHCVLDIIPFCNLKIYFNILLVLLIQPWNSFCFYGIHVHYCSFGWKNWNLIMKNIKTIEIILQILNSHFLYSSIWEQTYKISEDVRDLKELKHLYTQHKQMIPYVTCINMYGMFLSWNCYVRPFVRLSVESRIALKSINRGHSKFSKNM